MQIEKPQYYAGLADGEVQLNEVMGHILDAIVEHYDPLKKDENKVQELQPEVKKAADSAKSKSDSAK